MSRLNPVPCSSLSAADQEFLEQVESCQIGAGEFDHRAHVRYAWLALQQAPLLSAATRVCQGIYRFAHHHGAGQKYHHSLTLLCVVLIAQRMRVGMIFTEFLAANPDLVADLPQLLQQHYSTERLFSAAARCAWCDPDRAALTHSAQLAALPFPQLAA